MNVPARMRCVNSAGSNSDMAMTASLRWENGVLILLDQTRLPLMESFIDCHDYRRVAEAIRRLEVRGAPAIGAAAAFGLVLGAMELVQSGKSLRAELPGIAAELNATRPTAVNLSWALRRLMNVCREAGEQVLDAELLCLLEAEAEAIARDDRAMNEKISRYGATLFSRPTTILTHCNAGALATVAVGTALGVIQQAWLDGNVTGVYADETRPLLQGARLTAFELSRQGLPVTLITDNMAAWVMKTGRVQAVIVGADRIASNGDVANKIGTYGLAVLARAHDIPFYVAAPLSTFDFSLPDGSGIPIEERHHDEIFQFGGIRTAPYGIQAFNPAFDVTPADLVTAIITEAGVLKAPYNLSIGKLATKHSEGEIA